MRRLLLFIFCLFTLSGFVHAQRMSDEQVVEYVKNAQAAGKSQKQMTTGTASPWCDPGAGIAD